MSDASDGGERGPSGVVLFTLEFPFERGEGFLELELAEVAKRFDRVIIVPVRHRPGKTVTRRVPEGVRIVVADHPAPSEAKLVLRHMLRHPISAAGSLVRALRAGPRPALIVADLKFDLLAAATARQIERLLAREVEGLADIVFYGYWLDTPTRTAIEARTRLRRRDAPIVSRTHGFDLYADRRRHGHLPQRDLLVTSVDRVFSASRDGERYLRERHPDMGDRVTTAHLGTTAGIAAGNPTQDGHHLVSCSMVVPLKRLPMLIDDLAAVQERGVAVMWTHLGPGDPDYTRQVEGYARERLAPGSFAFLGRVPNAEVRRWYAENRASAFVSVSETEGGVPVSIMEALAQGLPVIATDVGGISELRGAAPGIFDGLIPADHTPAVFADRVEMLFAADPDTYAGYVEASLAAWRQRWSSSVNYAAFADALLGLARGGTSRSGPV